MIPTERLQAAIDRLTELRDSADYSEMNGWLVERVEECTCSGGTAESNYAHEAGCGFQPVTNDLLIVTLHRTIDAQLALLRLAQSYGDLPEGQGSRFTTNALALADAILGAAS